MKTSNPALNARAFRDVAVSGEPMTIEGAVHKTGFLLVLVILGAAYTWKLYFESGDPMAASPWMLIGGVGGFIVSLVTIFKATWSPITAPIYAVLEGLFLGGISSMFERRYPGLVIPSIGITFGTLLVLLGAFRMGLIRATAGFKTGIIAATGGIAIFYFLTMMLGFFHINMPLVNSAGPFGILFSVVVSAVAALNLVLDFDFIQEGAKRGMPKYMEWYAAFGLIVTLVWLYLEILRLMSKLRDNK